jgi:hypothetical protein
MRHTFLLAVSFVYILSGVAPALSQEKCGDHAWVHVYAVADIDAVVRFFGSVEGYRKGPISRLASPFAKGTAAAEFQTLDLCPNSSDDRLVRLFEVPASTRATANIQPGTLTLETRDYQGALAAAQRLVGAEPNKGAKDGKRSLWFKDAFGNTFIVWEAR